LQALLCYRCGSQVSDNSEVCPTCGLKLEAGGRRRPGTAEAPYRVGDRVTERYVVLELLGSGPVGHVFRVQDGQMEVELALKVINSRLVQMPEERTQFTLALRAGRKLSHPNLVRVYEEGLDASERPYFTTQLLPGRTLRQELGERMARGQYFTPQEAEPLLAQVAEALDSGHRHGPHSHLKPDNILLLPDLVKVTDYALALGIPRLPFLQAQKTVRAGCYLAPEYGLGGVLDTRMDLYSLGVIMGEMLTGVTPDGDIPNLLPAMPDLPPALESLYRRSLNADPLVRPRTGKEFMAEYTAALASPRAPAVDARARPRPPTAGGVSDKPPPPVPTKELPDLPSASEVAVPTLKVPSVGFSGSTSEQVETDPEVSAPVPPAPAPAPAAEAPHPEATQQMDAELISKLMEKDPELALAMLSSVNTVPRAQLPVLERNGVPSLAESPAPQKERTIPPKPVESVPAQKERTIPPKPVESVPVQKERTLPPKPVESLPAQKERTLPPKPVERSMGPPVLTESPVLAKPPERPGSASVDRLMVGKPVVSGDAPTVLMAQAPPGGAPAPRSVTSNSRLMVALVVAGGLALGGAIGALIITLRPSTPAKQAPAAPQSPERRP
jgi:eukaryotic-like serine/threonine-protein kinase